MKNQTMNFATSNLSRIKPKLRTSGKLTGNFGASKRTREAHNSGLGVTNAKVVKVTTQDEYLNKMYYVLDNAADRQIQQFAYNEIRKILIQRGMWNF